MTHSGGDGGDSADRRQEPRQSASGKVHLKFESGPQNELEVDLLDVSASGFRASHRHGPLPLGANASFRYQGDAGTARVVWNWVHPGHTETGFIIIR
jgi:hypothetical protein